MVYLKPFSISKPQSLGSSRIMLVISALLLTRYMPHSEITNPEPRFFLSLRYLCGSFNEQNLIAIILENLFGLLSSLVVTVKNSMSTTP